jgi:hypothetical protein
MLAAMRLLAGLALVAMLLAAPAHANSGDQQYLDTLTTYQLGCRQGAFDCPDGDSTMIQMGHAICHELLGGRTEVSVAAQVMRTKAGFGRDQAIELISTAEQSYCPTAGG